MNGRGIAEMHKIISDLNCCLLDFILSETNQSSRWKIWDKEKVVVIHTAQSTFKQ